MLKKLFQLMENRNTKIGVLIDIFLLCLILANIAVIVADSYSSFHNRYLLFTNEFEIFSIVIFTVEYALRLICSPYKYSNRYLFRNIFKYVISPMAIIDLLSILPFYLPLLLPYDLRVLRILRLFRLLRIFKITRYTKAIDLILMVFRKRQAELVLSTFILIVLVFLSSSLLYYIECDLQPDIFSNIIESTKWTIKTMVFLGYEHSGPLSPLGKLVGMLIVVLGLGWLTVPISIISSGFIDEIKEGQKFCKHCGKDL